jgi:pimeloyl-ACP methyl ester carboxylesterase
MKDFSASSSARYGKRGDDMALLNPAGPPQSPCTNLQPARAKRLRTILTIVAVLLAGAAALVYFRYRHDLSAAEARVSSGSNLISTPCGPIEYAEAGAGMPALVVHGAGGGFDQGIEFARPLIANGYRVIAPSRFGYLRTPLPVDASPMAQADAHACLLDALHLDKVAVLGLSAGAPSAMQFCLRHSNRCAAMVLAVPLAYSPQSAGRAPLKPSAFRKFLINATISSDFVFWIMSKLARDTAVKTILGTPPEDLENASAEEQARVAEVLTHIEPVSRRKKGLENEAAIAQAIPRYDLERFRVPALVAGVENCLYNTYPGARYTAEHIPGARFVGYPRGGHLFVGHQTEVWSEVEKFLKAAALLSPWPGNLNERRP